MDVIYNNSILLLLTYILIILLVIYVFYRLIHHFTGNFGEGNVYKRLKKIYSKYDYPFLKQIILPINEETYAYYDAIVFGDRFIYLIEIKNHKGKLIIDEINDWGYIDDKQDEHVFINAFYENDVKKHILNRFLNLNQYRIIELVVLNNRTSYFGEKGKNNLINAKQLRAFIEHFEAKENIGKINPQYIVKKGNELLAIDVKKRKMRKQVIDDLKDQRTKK